MAVVGILGARMDDRRYPGLEVGMTWDPETLTLRQAQKEQPWTVPYAIGVLQAHKLDVPHILATHCALHTAKSVGKLAAVFEALDHPLNKSGYGASVPLDAQLQTIKDMSADLVTAALRFGNLYGFSVAQELVRRVSEKNK